MPQKGYRDLSLDVKGPVEPVWGFVTGKMGKLIAPVFRYKQESNLEFLERRLARETGLLEILDKRASLRAATFRSAVKRIEALNPAIERGELLGGVHDEALGKYVQARRAHVRAAARSLAQQTEVADVVRMIAAEKKLLREQENVE